jgi:cytochrome c
MAGKPASYNACIGCHGMNGEKNTLVPESKPNTLSKAEIVEALKGYKAGTLNKYGKGAMMKSFSARLTDDQMNEIAEYIGK